MAVTDEQAELLRTARDLLSAGSLDVAATLLLLNTLSDTRGAAVSDTVRHAKSAVAACPGRDLQHQAVARYMVARVVVWLEQAGPDSAAGDRSAPGTARTMSR